MAYGAVLAILPGAASAGGGGLELRLTAFGHGTLWLGFLTLLAATAIPSPFSSRVLLAVLLGATAVVLLAGSPLPLLVVLLMVAEVLPGDADARRWRFALVLGAALLTGFSILRGSISDRASAFGITVGVLLLAGAQPFGSGLVAWVRKVDPRLAAGLLGCALPAALALAVARLPQLAALRQEVPFAITLAIVGAATLLGGALYSATSTDLRILAERGALADCGLALVALAAPGGLRGVALVLIALALTRPALVALAMSPGSSPIRSAAGWMATIGAAGLPPGVGFAARMTVLVGAFRVSGALAAVVVVSLLVELVGPFRIALGRQGFLASAGPEPAEAHQRAGWASAAPVAAAAGLGVLSLAAGLAPMQAASLFGLG